MNHALYFYRQRTRRQGIHNGSGNNFTLHFPDRDFKSVKAMLAGVSEAENAVKDQYGEDRLIEFAGSQDVNISSEEFVENLYQSVKAFTKENPQNDDITIMSVKL